MEPYPRITGTEMEWGLKTKPADIMGKQENLNTFLRGYLPENIFISNSYLSNGGRLYRDVGEHLEYATPEDASFKGTVINEIAGEIAVALTLQNLKSEGRIDSFKLNKRVIDQQGTTWGHHESYAVKKGGLEISQDSLALLGIHLATRNVWAGAGCLQETDDGLSFFVAQKALDLRQDFDTTTTTLHKPVVNLRNEPLASLEHWLRVHVTSGDANMSPWSTWMKLGTTSIVLRLIENGIRMTHLLPNDMLKNIAYQVAEDYELKRTIQLQNGYHIRPVEVQAALIEGGMKLQQEGRLAEEEEEVLEQWQRVQSDLEFDPGLASDRVEWLSRKKVIDSCQPHKKAKLRLAKQKAADMLWDEISPRGIGLKLRQTFWKKWMPAEQDIKHAVTHPPINTRAIIRGHFVTRAKKYKCGEVKNWQELSVDSKTVLLSNPYQTDSPSLNRALQKI